MTVKPGLADKEFQPATQGLRRPFHVATGSGEVTGGHRRCRRQSGGRPVAAEDLAQGSAPLSGGHSRPGTGNGRLHDVAALAGGRLQIIEGCACRTLVTAGAPCRQAGDL